ncbi:MAG: lytic transglycosylase domain-containing protein [Nitrospirae bacterium]|nr:lytic transglycosylase domain-containing protein [Candidatus Manganitrophaceae bacterium]
MIQRAKKYIKPCFFTLSMGFFLLHPLSAEFSPIASLSFGFSEATFARQALQTAREQKVRKILSRFHTGLQAEEEQRLAIFIVAESQRHQFDPELIIALISTESSFYNWSTSPKGAIGLMQMIPTTAKEVAEVSKVDWKGEAPLFDPFTNIKLGIHYLSTLNAKFGDLTLALTAYNYGPTHVVRWVESGEEIPTKYAEKVLKHYQEFLGLAPEEKEETETFPSV